MQGCEDVHSAGTRRGHVCTRGRGNRMEIQSFANKSVFKSMPGIGIMSVVQPFGTKGTDIIEVLRIE